MCCTARVTVSKLILHLLFLFNESFLPFSLSVVSAKQSFHSQEFPYWALHASLLLKIDHCLPCQSLLGDLT
jgi:hypothetical protein